jgi:hypothetical protein
MNRLMIDIETLSLRPTAKVLQIGYTATSGAGDIIVPPTDIWIDDPDGHVDPGTEDWWSKQDPAIRALVFAPPEGTAALNWHQSFQHMSDVYAKLGPDTEVWASPAMFDLPIITNLWRGDKPWKFFMERDMGTFRRTVDPRGVYKPASNAQGHLASADASWQMDYLIALLRVHDARGLVPA